MIHNRKTLLIFLLYFNNQIQNVFKNLLESLKNLQRVSFKNNDCIDEAAEGFNIERLKELLAEKCSVEDESTTIINEETSSIILMTTLKNQETNNQESTTETLISTIDEVLTTELNTTSSSARITTISSPLSQNKSTTSNKEQSTSTTDLCACPTRSILHPLNHHNLQRFIFIVN
ncbi:hypothetical protein PVAND_000126 [Polypedilum vanderplanki]|uniref:Uncharacterized protein n=1 Tax=Polypedilum vanderplanki TaxID=319348 RepID=A0A9J6BJX1_POLVA|nr:hypothetical protein PVAND_000126 [Polypedilum vanderplanki]